jgi:hypothetical protein
MKPTKIFAHKGYVGIEAGDQFINDPTKPGQLGCVVDLKNVVISQEAYDIIKGVRKSQDAIGDVMCWQADKQQCFGWMGGAKYLLHTKAEADRNYNPSLLKPRIEKVDPPADFIAAIKNIKVRRLDEMRGL